LGLPSSDPDLLNHQRWRGARGDRRYLLGTIKNAVRIQHAVALIAYLLLRVACASQRIIASLLTSDGLGRAT
jgi:hypothetical protein